MASAVLGRTNRAFPPVWLRPVASPDGSDPATLVEAALASRAPIDITTSPGLWGGQMRGTEATLVCLSSTDYEWATDDRHAGDLVDANLIQTLSCIGRTYLDIFFLRVRRSLEEFRIAGALQALELARQEGHIRHIGIACEGPALPTMALWQTHDAFDLLLARPDAIRELGPLARYRRVGIVALGEAVADADVRLISVRSAADIEAAQLAGASR